MRVRGLQNVILLSCLALFGGQAVAPAAAQQTGQTPDALVGIGVEERLGASVPGDLVFRNENGDAVPLATYLDGERPVVLNLVYHDCPLLCNILLDKFTGTLREMAWTPGGEFEVLTVSFNAIETPELARRQKERYVSLLERPAAAAGWHFLTGDAAAVEALTDAVGFSYRWIEAEQEFAHPAVLIFLDGEGRIMRYLYGLDFPAPDVRKALVEASAGRVGTTVDRFILFCFQYDPAANSYVPHAVNLMKLGGVLTLLALGGLLVVLWRREGRKQAAGIPTFS